MILSLTMLQGSNETVQKIIGADQTLGELMAEIYQ